MQAVEATGLSKNYRRGLFGGPVVAALRGLDLRIQVGQAFGVIGPNGAGKTTLIKTLLSVVRPTAGTVRVFGQNPELPSVRARIGYLPERLHLPNAATPLQFLSSVSRLKRLPDPMAEAERQLARVGMSGEAQRRMKGFSKGMKQRVGLAAALLGQPELLVLDEPTDGVDPLGRAEIRKILADEKRRGATLVLNSHLLSETERVCDAVGILARGVIVRQGALYELCGSTARWRVRFAPEHDEDALRGAGFVRTDRNDEYVYEALNARALNDGIDRARATGALLVELAPELRDLEEVLAEAVAS